MVFSQCSRGQQLMAVDAQGKQKKIFVTYGDVSLPVELVDKAIDQQTQQIPPDILNSLPPEYRLQAVAQGITALITDAEIYQLAVRKGFKLDEASVKRAFHSSTEQEFRAYVTDALRKQGKLKPNSTDKELDDLIVTETKASFPPNGKTLSAIFKDQNEQLDKALKDPDKQLETKLQASKQFLKDQLEAGIKATDDDVKKSFEKRTLKRIVFKTDAKTKPEDAKVKADKAYGELKAGKSFEQVMDAYSEDVPNPGKKLKSENTIDVSSSSIDQIPDLKVAAKLQEGAYTDPQKVTEGYAIFKYVGKKMDIPKDFDAKKDDYKKKYVDEELGRRFTDEKTAIEKEVKPVFEIKAYEGAYRLGKAMTMPAGPDQDKEFQAIYDLTKTVSSSDDKPDIAASVQVAAIQHLYDAPSADKMKLKPQRLAALENYLTFFDNWAYRKDVIDNFKDQKQGDKAFAQIMTAMEKNTKYDAQGQNTFSDVAAKFLEIKAANIGVNADMEKQFRTKQDEWKKEKEAADKAAADLKKQQDEEAKKNKQPSTTGGGSLIPPGSVPPKK